MTTDEERQYAPYTYNIGMVDYQDETDRTSYGNFVNGETYCDVSAYDGIGMVRFDFFGDWDPEHRLGSALTRAEAAESDFALVIDVENPGYAHVGELLYAWTSRKNGYGEYDMCFKLVEE